MYVCIVIRKNFVKCNVTVLVLVLSENVVVLCAKSYYNSRRKLNYWTSCRPKSVKIFNKGEKSQKVFF